MLRTHTCGELRKEDAGKSVILCGWVQRVRNLGGMTFVDLRDRYGITQLVFNMQTGAPLCELARKLGREYVLRVSGKVLERSSKNPELLTGDIEIIADKLEVLNPAKTPPFTIEDDTDGGEEQRMRYRYLDLRRNVLKNNLLLRHRALQETRKYLSEQGFLELETPFLIKSTPEGARDFVVPSRIHPGQFYALPQSPQTFKQLLMVAGYDKYFQVVRCFRDEDLRADRQPEFTQIDCEMSFMEQEDVLLAFEGLVRHLLKEIKGIDLPAFPRMRYDEAMRDYGTDKPDTRFGMKLKDMGGLVKGKGFNVFDKSELVAGICAPGCAGYSRRQLDELTDFVTRPQIGAKGLVWAKMEEDGAMKSSVDKFFQTDDIKKWFVHFDGKKEGLLLIIAGEPAVTQRALSELRLKMGERLGLRNKNAFAPLFVIDFPLFEWNGEEKRWDPRHHPFTSPKPEDIAMFDSDPGNVKANAYDLVLNGVEIAGGSIRIHNKELQKKIFRAIGLTDAEAEEKFGFLMNAFEYGAPPHGGIAFGFDRLTALLDGSETIRDYIAFPKNNAGRDLMLNAPAGISEQQLKELSLGIKK